MRSASLELSKSFLFAETINDFCNKICQLRTHALHANAHSFDHLVGAREQHHGKCGRQTVCIFRYKT